MRFVVVEWLQRTVWAQTLYNSGHVKWARKPVNHTCWVAVVTPTDRPKSVRNRCLIEFLWRCLC